MITQINPGTLINNRYLIQKLLGQGGFGRTYLAFDTQRFGEACVLKEFVPQNTQEKILYKSRELFEREAKVLYQLQHPQIPKFLAWLVEDERLFIVQEYIDGKTYSQILYERLSAAGNPFSETEIKAWLIDLLPTLEYIHERNIIHRDISLDNIMLPHNQSKPVLIDFGVVKEKMTQIFSNDSSYTQYSIVGKIGYSPIEQLRLGQCYPSSDLYALGVCAVVLLTGKTPYLLMDESLDWQWRSYVKVSDFLGTILDKMLAHLPGERYQSAREVILELKSQSHSQSNTVTNSVEKINTFQERNQKHTEDFLNLEQLRLKLQDKNETSTKSHPQMPISLNREFLEYSQRELMSFIGPIASVLVKNTLKKNKEIAPKQFIEELTSAIPDAQEAQEFRNRLQLNFINTNYSQNSTAINHPEFLQNCRRELTTFIGPSASIILEDTLVRNPDLTPKQLIESLVAEIPNPKRAQQFKERIDKLQR